MPDDLKREPVPANVPALCLEAFLKHKKPDALNYRRGNTWQHISGETVVTRVRQVALGLTHLGVQAGDRIALLSENRPEWSITDLAILSLGAVNVPIFTTQPVDQVRFILDDSGARVLIVSTPKLLKRVREGVEPCAGIEKVILFDVGQDENRNYLTLDAIEETGAHLDKSYPDGHPSLLNAVGLSDLATIIYTSGTTGEPKGVMLTHGNFVSNVLSITDGLPISSVDVSLSVLPLSHIFERACFYVFCRTGVSVFYARSADQLAEYFREVKPTIMTAVPRLFEKVYHRIVKKGSSGSRWRRALFSWAMNTGRAYAETKDKHLPVPPLMEVKHAIADRLVFSKWREAVGGRLRYFVSGGAPLSPVLSYSFLGAGVSILQGYGMTETCIVSANRPDSNRVGSVGLPFSGIEVKADAEGEILVRGENVMPGYYNHPEDTKGSFTADGWFRTGDMGSIHADGHLFITDRKKELFKLSNGKYIAPQLIESIIKQSPLVSQVVVVGASRKFPSALIVPDWEALNSELSGEYGGRGALLSSTRLGGAAAKRIQKEISELTAPLADYERVRRVALLPEELTVEGGELTPTLKVKRRVVDEKYKALIEELYS